MKLNILHLQGHDEIHPHDRSILALQNVNFRYNSELILDQINFELKPGQHIALVGPNGAGKSTLLKLIAGLLSPSSGRVEVFGSAPKRHICIAYIPQRSQVDWHFPATVEDIVMMGRYGRIGTGRRPGKEDWIKVQEALHQVELDSLKQRQIGELSGGQQQRVFIARALAQEAELMLLDEPLTGLDFRAEERLLSILEHLNTEDMVTILSLHDLRIAREHFSAVMLLNQKIISYGPPEQALTAETLALAYHSHLHVVANDRGQLLVSDMCCGDTKCGDERD